MSHRLHSATYTHADHFLLSLAQSQTRTLAEREARGLAPMQRLLDSLGNPEQQLPRLIHITGSKGKGSTALICESLLQSAGYRTGVYTSPHYQHFGERIRIDGQPLSPAEFDAAIHPIHTYKEDNPEHTPSFAEALTAAAICTFAKAALDVVIIEVNMGGRLDPTNVLDNDIALLTSLEREHTEALGASLEAITAEKTGIFRPDKQAIVGAVPPALLPQIAKHAYQQKTNINFINQSIEIRQTADGWRLRSPWLKVDLPSSQQSPIMTLPAQRNNVALAICAVTALNIIPPEKLLETIDISLSHIRLPGRLDWQSPDEQRQRPARLIDSAHTAASVGLVKQFIAHKLNLSALRRVRVIVSVATNKEPLAMLQDLLPLATEIYCYQANERSMSAEQLAAALRDFDFDDESVSITPLYSHEAFTNILQDTTLDADDLLILTGSTYLAGEVYRVLEDLEI